MSPDTSSLQINAALMSSAMTAGKAAPSLPAAGNLASIKKTARDFEAVFINEMLSPMFEGLDSDGMFSGGQSEGMFRSMMVDQYSKNIASQGGFGLASSVEKAMLKMQGLRAYNGKSAAPNAEAATAAAAL